ncbi:type II toxin-antitoxin system MqsR family toxin [Cupriavidus sp. RAF20_2]|jgi:motility quorum-sensing regulator/GCU-specific mRNA interferase toxin|uniref:type II toxin-antitoxin system MqsR family toxin n=1 Tax=Cupriavidus sp. RAF20_2 TaxID=3233053 RepID=UPI003F8EEED1
MEKSSAHYKLSVVRALVTEGRLERSDLYKSMTTHADHRVWQDVYHPVTPYGSLYLKLSVIEQLVIVSFKVL